MKKCKVAILDSGIDKKLISSEDVLAEIESYDDNGHGTMCYSIIKKMAPNTEFLVSKLLNENLETSSERLIHKLQEICHDKDVDIIHLSLSTDDSKRRVDLEKMCRKIYENGKVIIASHNNRKDVVSYPCNFPTVIGVDGGIFETDSEFVFKSNKMVQAVANKVPTLVKGKDCEYHFFGGTSKAAACMTGIVASSWFEIQEVGINRFLEMAALQSKKKVVVKEIPEVKKYVEKEIISNIKRELSEKVVCEMLHKFEIEFQSKVIYENIMLLDFINANNLCKKLSQFVEETI